MASQAACFIVSILVIISLSQLCKSTRLPPQWCSFIAKVCHEFDDKHPSPPMVSFDNCPRTLIDNVRTPLMPPMFLWSPLEQFSMLKEITMCPKCTSLGAQSALHPSGWRDGAGGQQSEPRKIYCLAICDYV